MGPADEGVLESYYNDSKFLPSVGLAQLAQLLKGPGGAGGSGGPASNSPVLGNAATNKNKKVGKTKGRSRKKKASIRKQAGKAKK